MTTSTDEYDIAFSFAGEQREYVENTKLACEKLGLRVFYDRDKNNEWWGKNFISEQRKVYGSRTRFFVPFISPEYFLKPIPADEFEAAMWAAVQKGDEYILPVIIGGAKIPAEKLHPHTHYLKAENYNPEQLAQELYTKVKGSNQSPQEITSVIEQAFALTMPRLTPRNFSKYKEAEATLSYLSEQFKKHIHRLEQMDLIGTVKINDRGIQVRVEDEGETVFGLNIFPADGMGEASIGFNLDWNSFSTNSYHGTAQPFFDKERGAPALKIFDLSLFGMMGSDLILTKEELFEKLWQKMVEDIEARSRR